VPTRGFVQLEPGAMLTQVRLATGATATLLARSACACD
jgi:hypothetical protein